MFRKNYLPRLEIRKSSKTGKFFACGDGNSLGDKSFVETDEGYYMSWCEDATQYDSIDKLMESVYRYAMLCHVKDIHNNLTYHQFKVKL